VRRRPKKQKSRRRLGGSARYISTRPLPGPGHAIGDANTTTVTITGSPLIKLVGNVEITGNLTVDDDLAIVSVESGGGTG
jgi:hypothetical protein